MKAINKRKSLLDHATCKDKSLLIVAYLHVKMVFS